MGIGLGSERVDPPDPTARGITSSPIPSDVASGVGVAVTITVWKITIGVAVNARIVIVVGNTTGVMIAGFGSVPQPASANSIGDAEATISTRRVLVIEPGVVVRPVFVIMRGIEISVAGMNRMVIAERDTFEVARRGTGVFGLTEGHVVWSFAFKDEIGRLLCR